jgi:hypothetical protein
VRLLLGFVWIDPSGTFPVGFRFFRSNCSIYYLQVCWLIVGLFGFGPCSYWLAFGDRLRRIGFFSMCESVKKKIGIGMDYRLVVVLVTLLVCNNVGDWQWCCRCLVLLLVCHVGGWGAACRRSVIESHFLGGWECFQLCN